MTSNQDEGMRWLSRSLGWEQSLDRIRHTALADAATAGTSVPPDAADEPDVTLEPAAASDLGDPAGDPVARSHGRRRSEVQRSPRPRGAGVVVGNDGTPAGARRSA